MSRERYLINAQRVLDEAHRRKNKGVAPCSECEHSRIGLTERYCVHPIVQVAQRNCDDSYYRGRLADCSSQRKYRSVWGPVVCGPDGELFEPRDMSLVGVIYRFLGSPK